MKGRVALIILILICAGLGIGLLVRHNQALHESQVALAEITTLSNTVKQTQEQVNELKSVNMTLETNLFGRTHELETVSNNLVNVSATLAKTEAEAKAAAEA